MKILFMHPNMPGQYRNLCPTFAKEKGNQIVFVTAKRDLQMEGVHKLLYQTRRHASPYGHRYLHHTENAVLQGQEVWRSLNKLKKDEGFVPDVIVAHPGWGDALFVKDVYPDTPLFSFFEFYYHGQGADVGFDPDEPVKPDDLARVRTKNMHHLLNLVNADWGISPTFWQHGLHPKEFHHKITPIHDGVDTDKARPNADAVLEVGGHSFKLGDEVVTYIARNFEPYRGFPTFMQAAERILKERPNCHIIAVGADDVSYGKKAGGGKTYRQIWQERVKLDTSRIHYTGHLPYDKLITMMQISAAHIYLTYPFVLSWSALEAMACGCIIVGSKTPPVEEVIEHGRNGFLVDFYDPAALASQVIEVLDKQAQLREMREVARADIVHKYALRKLLPLHMDLIREVADGQLPPPSHEKVMGLYDKQ